MRPTRPGWWASFLVGCIATALALRVQSVLRDVWQIRTLPERVMEWLLLFVPLNLFERALQQLGAQAKDVALVATVVGMAMLLLLLGTSVVHADWSSWRLLALGPLLWLVAMGIVQPITGGGFFGAGLLQSPLLINAAYLMMFLGYSSVLIAGRLLMRRTPVERARTSGERRALLASLGSTLAALGVARFAGRGGGLLASSLPLAAAPTPRPTPPATAVPTRQVARPTGVPTAQATALPAATATPPVLAPAQRPLTRNQDGSLTAAGRPRGTLAPPITSNADFYVVTKNAVADPEVDAATWRLVIDGEVKNPVQLDYRTLRMLPSVDVTKTLECISNFTAQCNLAAFGCDLISTARWRGARLSDVLDLAGGLKADVMTIAFLSIDEFSAGLPVDIADDPEALIVYEMNGQPLPREHGYPARLLVPGRYGMKNPKWLAAIRPMNGDYLGWYEQRNWNKDGVVKTMARIDVPTDGAVLAPGPQRLAGIAYAGARGVQLVEVSYDGGQSWQDTVLLEPALGTDTMVRWQSTFTLSPSDSLNIVVRATDGEGTVQSAQFTLPQPDGASGRHAIQIQAG